MRNGLPRLGIQQRVLPAYRVPFFDALGKAFPQGVGVFAGQPRPEEMIDIHARPAVAEYFPARNRHILRGAFYMCAQENILSWLESWQPDVLVAAINPRDLRTGGAIRWMHNRTRPVLGWGLGAPGKGGLLQKVSDVLWAEVVGRFDGLIAYSQQGAAEYARLGFSEKRIFVAPNAVAARPTQPAPQRPDVFPDGRATVLYVGRLQARKRLDALLQACASLPAQLQPTVCVVGDGPERTSLESLADVVYPSARFYGALHGEALAALFRAADLFILPGTGGLAVQEAMSFALPVIVAEADGTQSELVRPENGWMVPPGETDALRNTLQEALSDAPRLRRMGGESFRIVRDEVNLEQMVTVFAQAVATVW